MHGVIIVSVYRYRAVFGLLSQAVRDGHAYDRRAVFQSGAKGVVYHFFVCEGSCSVVYCNVIASGAEKSVVNGFTSGVAASDQKYFFVVIFCQILEFFFVFFRACDYYARNVVAAESGQGFFYNADSAYICKKFIIAESRARARAAAGKYNVKLHR